MLFRPSVDPTLCFVLIPFREPFLGYYDLIIKPAASGAGLQALKADEIYGTRPIIQDIWNSIWQATVVVADVTDRNPNVNYELGICHCLGVPTILISQKDEDVPFDYRHRRYIRYNTTKANWAESLRNSITKTISTVLSESDLYEDLRWPYETNPTKAARSGRAFVSSDEAFMTVMDGVNLVAEPIARAFGPHGGHVSVRFGSGEEQSSKNGLVIAQGTRSSNRLEMKGIGYMQRAAQEMHTRVGDGTKFAMMLLRELLAGARAAIDGGHRHRGVIDGMERAVEVASEALRKAATLAPTVDTLRSVSLTAAAGLELVPPVVLEALKKVGRDGLVRVQESSAQTVELEVVEGVFFDQGYLSSELADDDQEVVLADCLIFIYQRRLSVMRDLLPLLEQVARSGKPLLVIAEDIEGEALSTLIVNNKKQSLLTVAVRAPGRGDRRTDALEDLAAFTGGVYFTEGSGVRLESIRLSQLGTAKRVHVTRTMTIVQEGGGFEKSRAKLLKRIEAIKGRLEKTHNAVEASVLRERLAQLNGAVATIRVGGTSRPETLDLKYTFESAVASCRASIEEGVLPGGGTAFLNISKHLRGVAVRDSARAAGAEVVARALASPVREGIRNAKGNVEELMEQLAELPIGPDGFDAESSQIVDMVQRGVLDPAKSCGNALRIAFSYAKSILQTDSWSTDD
jgi:chaperonin GroEL